MPGFGFGFGFGNNLHTQGGLLNEFLLSTDSEDGALQLITTDSEDGQIQFISLDMEDQ